MKINKLFEPTENVNLKSYLKRCGISDVSRWLNSSFEDENEPYPIIKIDEARRMIATYIPENKPIYIVADEDVDGLLSAVVAYLTLKDLFHISNITILFHEKKVHGLHDDIMQKLTNSPAGLVWIVDAGTSDKEQCKILYNLGFQILITDHHVPDTENPYAHIINCMTMPVTNKELSGCGVTWKIGNSSSLLPYVAISLISDSMDMRTYENSAIMREALTHKPIPLVKIILDANSCEYTNRKSLAFTVIPAFNAVIRQGSIEDKLKLFKCLAGELSSEETNSVYIMCMDFLHQQKEKTNELVESLDMETNTPDKIIIADIKENTAYTGLVANQIMSKTNKPTLLYHDSENNKYQGSARSNISLLPILANCKLFDKVQGHDNSFGFTFGKDKLNDIKIFCNNLDIPEPCYTVIASVNNADNKAINNLFDFSKSLDYIYGMCLNVDSIYLEPCLIYTSNIARLGINGDTLKWSIKGITYITFHVKKYLLSYLDKHTSCKIEGIITPKITVFKGRTEKQMILSHLHILN